MDNVHGSTDDAYAEVREVFAKTQVRDAAAQLAVWAGGRLVVDLWTTDAGGGDTLTGVYSATKGATHLVVARLVQEGALELDRRVTAWWPEFAGDGKDDLTLRDLLAHRSGLIGVDDGFGSAELDDDRVLADRLLRQSPYWRPGRAYGYHAFVIGALLSAVVVRATGRTVQELFPVLIKTPYGVDVHLGAPNESRYLPVLPAPVQAPAAPLPPSPLAVAFNLHATPPTDLVAWINRPSARALGQSSAGGVANARGLARMYAVTMWGADGREPLLTPDTMTSFATLTSRGRDRVTGESRHFGLGFENQHLRYPGLTATAFGHSGAAGSHAFADPMTGIAYAYTRRRYGHPGGAAPENADLISAVLRAT
ncbi:serine hydrolase [Actinoplanes italicus]|uniref:CubicO group peptidase (Beta-lactamase class C family) n=2 Tax=Actinoplanes italicus TaxID=113567 RepID=A0A2T0JD19_9ACTN|nr:serine hydrolase domain-containing protein [Actinoplanes italicus]PRX05526.1 CubicO group peptidase (beta-lactamase class C family) [Actinoplanes italicus]GIE35966.1 serine hydrolase [Actinoplanes italicus]